MSVQSLKNSCQSLYSQGKYKDCLAELERSKTKELPVAEKVEALLLAAKIKRELSDDLAAADLLENAKTLVEKANDLFLELEVEMVLNAVHGKLVKNKDAAKKLVQQSELVLNKIRALERGPNYDRLYLTALCELGMTKIYAGDIELAAQNLRLASGLAEETFGKDSAEMIYPALCLSIVHALEDKHSLSLVMARNATQTARANYGKQHPLLIHPLYRLAQAATRRKLFDMALDNSRLVEGLIIDNIGEASEVYLDLLGIKTAAFMSMVEFQAAEKMATKRLKLMEKMRGKDDPRLVDPLCDLAQILARLGERERAEIFFERALKLVTELARQQGFPEEGNSLEEAPANTAGTRLENESLCHLEYNLIESLSDCYLWQGKLADAARLMPASYRSAHTCRVDKVVSILESIGQHFEERARNLELPT